MNWRYVERPNSNYEILALYKKEKLHGFIVYTSINKHNGRVGYIMELITRPESKDKSKVLLHHAQNNFISNKVDFVLAWCFTHSPNHASYTSLNYWSLPDKLRPIELHFGYASFKEENQLLTKRENWYLSYSDSDTV